ncbi:hypothetical protein KY495_15285 [Massilia sp. PAMC28688]|uniref:hypothetical protein n=1 Tax=Massilia sp. PAMC28688 TaxID=2861283 RepID=UPI001C6386C3|nr:hypothetical protein [Massilia sp. PAMC28688]QYF92126.1 hypothetical protein KY495_15285 [Massilia sp. PAMC28688]
MNAAFDPAPTLARVKVPVLWFLGELDHNVPSARSCSPLHAALPLTAISRSRCCPALAILSFNRAPANNKEFATHPYGGGLLARLASLARPAWIFTQIERSRDMAGRHAHSGQFPDIFLNDVIKAVSEYAQSMVFSL